MVVKTSHGFEFEIDIGSADYRSPDGWRAGQVWADEMKGWLMVQDFDTLAAIWAMDQMLGTAFHRIPATPATAKLTAAQAAAAKKATTGWLTPDEFSYPSICARPRLE